MHGHMIVKFKIPAFLVCLRTTGMIRIKIQGE